MNVNILVSFSTSLPHQQIIKVHQTCFTDHFFPNFITKISFLIMLESEGKNIITLERENVQTFSPFLKRLHFLLFWSVCDSLREDPFGLNFIVPFAAIGGASLYFLSIVHNYSRFFNSFRDQGEAPQTQRVGNVTFERQRGRKLHKRLKK